MKLNQGVLNFVNILCHFFFVVSHTLNQGTSTSTVDLRLELIRSTAMSILKEDDFKLLALLLASNRTNLNGLVLDKSIDTCDSCEFLQHMRSSKACFTGSRGLGRACS